MQQARRILSDCQFFEEGLADLDSHDEVKFMKKFFALFAKRFGLISGWDELEEHVNRCPSVLFLDDLGEVTSPGLRALVPALVARLTQHEIKLRVIATSSKPLEALFVERGVNPKHSEPWKRITIVTCNNAEAQKLLQLLPRRSRKIAIGHLFQIEQISRFAPQRLQRLCFRLFEGEYDGLSDKELLTLVENSASYK